jgi:hypothetical protein
VKNECHGRKFGYIGGGFTKGLKNEIKFKNTMGSKHSIRERK